MLLSLVLMLQAAQPRVVITPAQPTVVAGDTLRLRAQVVDASGQPMANVRVRFQQQGGQFEATVDSTGLVTSGAAGVLPVVASAIIPGVRPIVQRIDVRMVPGPATRVVVSPQPRRMVGGQRLRLDAKVFSAGGDARDDRIEWRSSAPNVIYVTETGVITAGAPGRATVTAVAGNARGTLDVTVVPGRVGRVSVTAATPRARTGDVVRFRAEVRDSAGRAIEGLTPLWLLTPGKGEIDADGAFVAYEPGTYTVKADFGTASGDAVIVVSERDVRRKATVVGQVIRTQFPTAEVWVHPNGRVAYLGTHLGGDRFYAIDISNPANPVIVDSLVDNFRIVNDIMTTADGKYLVYTREGADNRVNGIGIASVEDPLHPKKIADFSQGVTSGVHSAFVYTQPNHGTHVYLTNDATGALHIVDINNPREPKEVATWRTPRKFGDAGRQLHDVDVQDGLLYGSWWNDGLIILDVGNGIKGGSPRNPQIVAQYKYNLDKLYKDVELEGGKGFIRGTHTAWRHKNYVFIADEVFGNDAIMALMQGKPSRAYGRMQVIDVSDLNNPKSVAWYEPEYGGVHNVWVTGDTLYMGAYNAGFRAFDISGELRGDLRAQGREMAHVNPAHEKGFVPNVAMTWGVVVKNNLAFVNDFNSGLWIVRLEPKTQVVP
ncbi:MAG TPA: Ig-like domain-containing protein [Gemmatimonadaceae bacterium]|nr:Ig-like domain-containing protein [Gemmatimonadaceae bacterium]